MQLQRVFVYLTILLIQLIGFCAAVHLKIENDAGHPIDVFWVSTDDGYSLVKQNEKPIRPSAHFDISSFDAHQFVVRHYKANDEGVNEAEATFTKGPIDEVVSVTFDEESNALVAKVVTTYDKILPKVEDATAECEYLQHDKTEYATCIGKKLAKEVLKVQAEKTQLVQYRDAISSRLRNYTCADQSLPSSEPIFNLIKTINDIEYDIKFHLNMSHAKIWYINDFVTEAECNVLKTHGKPRLLRATVAAEDGTSIVSENRKAQQAGYDLHHRNGEKDPLWNLHKRILGIMNDVAGYALESPGQEGFTIIQYNPDDQYTPHCDGSCDNSPVSVGGRIGTAVMYCEEPGLGGATTFTKAGVHVKPQKGAVTFFSYMGPDLRMDDGYTEHSGCPVVEGEKWITTFWMRYGVTAQEDWTKFDPSGIRLL